MIIYMATNRINGKEYIGKTTYNLDKRKQQHIQDSIYNRNKCYFHSALKKYGINNFDWEVLCECDNINSLNRAEIYYINLYNTYSGIGYNMTIGGDGNVRVSFSKKQEQEVIKLYVEEKIGLRNISKLYNCSYNPIRKVLINNNITIRDTGIEDGGKGAFKKGQDPWNKNIKGIHLSPKSEFKKGNIPWNKVNKNVS